MTSITSVSSSDLKDRRKQLRRRRRMKVLQAIWRSLFVAGMAGGLVWVITLPGWVIRQPEQIDVEGNQLLLTEAILSSLPLSYPQSLLQLKPEELAETLETRASIAEARVTRQLFPPGVTLEIRERKPVAIAISPTGKAENRLGQPLELGYLDET
ncbi:MAG: cell division protein FtsQ/DivIB, partial [Cyanobacteriota bacterium]